MWSALFHSKPLRSQWLKWMRQSQFEKLQSYLPYSWIIDPSPVPHYEKLINDSLQDGIITLADGPNGHVLALTPPFDISDEEALFSYNKFFLSYLKPHHRFAQK